MKVKIFTSTKSGICNKIDRTSLDELEGQVADWLKENPSIKFVDIKQSAAGGSWGPIQLFISVWYEPAA